MPNFNPETGIAYGYVAANYLDGVLMFNRVQYVRGECTHQQNCCMTCP